jgi:MFS family permease
MTGLTNDVVVNYDGTFHNAPDLSGGRGSRQVISGQAWRILRSLMRLISGRTSSASTANTLLGDLTIKEQRGKTVGKFNAIVSVSSAAGLLLGGYLARAYGLQYLFYLASISIASSTALLFFLKEKSAI